MSAATDPSRTQAELDRLRANKIRYMSETQALAREARQKYQKTIVTESLDGFTGAAVNDNWPEHWR